MSVVYFFDLPVYRLNRHRYFAQLDHMLQRQYTSTRYGPSEEMKQWYKEHQFDRFGCWQYNEIVAYIRLHFVGNQIRGEYFSAEKKRSRLSRSKLFVFRDWKLAPEISLGEYSCLDNASIWAKIQEYIERCREELAKGRVIDDEMLHRLGPNINWKALVGGETTINLEANTQNT
ncbi:MAG: hypothetical protein AAGJ94_06685 [Pseudomonadota bacterium]